MAIHTSIIIVTWNQKHIVSQCLASLDRYYNDPTAEVIVVDNASSDGVPEMIRELFPKVKLLAQNSNLGFAKGNNVGLAKCSGEFICLVNSDVVVPPNCIEALTDYLKQNPNVGMVGPKMLLPDGMVGQSCMGFPTVWNWFCRALALDVVFAKSPLFGGYLRTDFGYDRTQDVDVLTGWFWVVRREALDQVGPLDDRYFFYGDDIDWSKRFHKAGWRVVFFADASAIHHCGASSAKAPLRFHIEKHRANLQFCKKFYAWPVRVGLWMALCLQEIVRILGYGVIYVLRSSARENAGFKIRRSAVSLSWLVGFSPKVST
jgi:GT2 family glycosyltransferase